MKVTIIFLHNVGNNTAHDATIIQETLQSKG